MFSKNHKKSDSVTGEYTPDRFRDFVEMLPEGIYEADLAGRITYANRHAMSLFGYKPEKIEEGFHILEAVIPEDRPRVHALLPRILSGESTHGEEYTALRCDGTVFPVLIYSSPVILNKCVRGLRGLIIDITDRKKSGERISESEAKYRLLLNSTGEAIYGIDTDGNCTFCNPQCLRLLGFHHQDQLIGKNMHLLIHHSYKDGRSYPVDECRIYQAYFRGEGTHFSDEVLWKSDGTSFPAEIRSFPQFQAGVVVGAVVTFTAITERKHVEQALKQSETKYRLLFENMTAGFALHEMIYDDHGHPVDYRFLEINPAFEMLTGASAANLIGRTVREVMPTTEQYWIEVYGKVAQTGEPMAYQNYSREMDRYYDIWAFSPQKHLFAVIFSDITDRKRTEESLRLDEDRLTTLLQLSQMKFQTEKELTDFALEEAVRITRSKGGYLHFFNADEMTIHLHSWSSAVLRNCKATEMIHYPLDAAGIWADSIRNRQAVIHNDYQSVPGRKGYPAGHFHLARHLSIPILDGERITGIIGVGNKEQPYDGSDVRQLTLFMDSMWRILKQRRSDEERDGLISQLQKAAAEIKTLSGMLPICSSCKKIRDDKGYWNQIESYISERSDAEFTHGICPDCAKRMYAEFKNISREK